MTIVTTSTAGLPTTLQVVNRVLLECGVEQVSSLSPGNDRSNLVLEALNDGMYDIYAKAIWPWTRQRYSVPYVAGQYEYPVPSDFRAMCLAPYNWSVSTPAGASQMKEFSPEEFFESFPPQNMASGTGAPWAYTIDAYYIRFYPAPDSNSITTYPQAVFTYFKWPQRRQTTADDNSTFDVPIQMIPALVRFGKAQLKKYLEYPDWSMDMQEYDVQVSQQLASNKQTRQPYAMRQLYGPSWRF